MVALKWNGRERRAQLPPGGASVAPSVLPSLLQDEAMKTLLLALLGLASLLQLTLSLRIGAFNIRAFGDKKLSNQTISSSIVRVSPSDCTGETLLWQPGSPSSRAHPWPRSSFPWAEVPAASELTCPTWSDRSLTLLTQSYLPSVAADRQVPLLCPSRY